MSGRQTGTNDLVCDLLISPPRIVFLETDDKMNDFLADGGPTERHAILGSIILAGNQVAVPPENRVGGKEFCTSLQQDPAEPLGLGTRFRWLTLSRIC